MGTISWEWEGMVTARVIPHTSNTKYKSDDRQTTNWTGSFSSGQFSAVHWIGDELRRLATTVAGSWQPRTGDGRRQFNSQRETEL